MNKKQNKTTQGLTEIHYQKSKSAIKEVEKMKKNPLSLKELKLQVEQQQLDDLFFE